MRSAIVKICSPAAFFFIALLFSSCEEYDLARTNPLDTKAPFPDLVIQNQSVTPSTVKKGYIVSVSCNVVNQGTSTADFPYLQFDGIYFFLSADTEYQISDVSLGSENIDDIAAGTQRNLSGVELTIPGTTIAGNYYILFYADYENDVKESREDNNVSHFAIQVTN